MEGPSLRILLEELKPFVGSRIANSYGNSKQIDPASLIGRPLSGVKAWGKQLLLHFGRGVWIRVHFLMYGSYRINERREGREPRLSLQFDEGEVNFYSCSVKLLTPAEVRSLDWSADPMSRAWDEKKALRAIRARPDEPVCDILMDQSLFSGVGNIIKNEVLFRRRLHPLTRAGDLTSKERRELVRDARRYCFQFRDWKKKYELRRHWRIYRQRACAECGRKPILERTGRFERMSFRCPVCQPERSSARRHHSA